MRCALGWACWKTYVGRPEATQIRIGALSLLGNGLSAVKHHEDALVAYEAQLPMMRCIGAPEQAMLTVQSCLANTYAALGRLEKALRMERDVYSGRLKLHGEEHGATLLAANNYAISILHLGRFGEAKSLLRKTMPVARRVLGENHETALSMGKTYAMALFLDNKATLDDLREAVTTLEDVARTARRVLGGSHPLTAQFEENLREGALQGPCCHARRSPRGRDDARECTTDRAARVWRRASVYKRDRGSFGTRASGAPRPRRPLRTFAR